MANSVEMSAKEAITRLQQMGGDLALEVSKWLGEDDFEESRVLWYDGNLEVADFCVPDVVIVTGDLVASGILHDCGESDGSFLAVFGDLSSKNTVTMGCIMVGGHVKTQELVYGNSLNDHWLEVGGDLHAKALVEGGHYCQVQGRIDVVHAIRTHNQISSKADSSLVVQESGAMQKVFVDAVLDDGIVDRDLLLGHLRASGTVLTF